MYEEYLQHILRKISEAENNELTRTIEEKEVADVVCDLHPNKAPGPDGSPISFYKNNWTIIKNI